MVCCFPSLPIRVQWCHIGSLELTMVGVFTLQLLASTSNQGFSFPESWSLSIYQHITDTAHQAWQLNVFGWEKQRLIQVSSTKIRVYFKGIYWKKREIEHNGDPRTWRSKALLQGLRSWELEGGFGSNVTPVTSEHGLGLYALIHCYFHGTCFFIFWPQLVSSPSSLNCLSVMAFASVIFHSFGLYWLIIAIPAFHCLLLFEDCCSICFVSLISERGN